MVWIFGNTYYHLRGYEFFLYRFESCLLCVLLCPDVGTGAMGAAEGSCPRLVAAVASVCLLFMTNKKPPPDAKCPKPTYQEVPL